MIVDEQDLDPQAPPPEPFAWKHFLAIVLGLAAIIGTVCAIATLGGKQEAVFSLDEGGMAAKRLA